MLEQGLLFQRPDGQYETADERDRRLAHNCRMRFNRTFDSALAICRTAQNQTYTSILNLPINLSCIPVPEPDLNWLFCVPGPACPQIVLEAAKGKRYSSLANLLLIQDLLFSFM